MTDKIKAIIAIVEDEMERGRSRYGAYHNAHEQYAVLKEEVEEWWDSIKKNCEQHHELIQVIAVAMRYLGEQGDVDSLEYIHRKRWEFKEKMKS